MKLFKSLSLKRITSSGNYMPELDGLRFIAISSIVLYHINGFMFVKAGPSYKEVLNLSHLQPIFIRGHLGVPLFFVISGFILSLPIAKAMMLDQSYRPDLTNYFFRRLTRLEPPYLLVMTLLLFASVFIVKKLSWTEGIESYLASIFYLHNFSYGTGERTLLNPVAWSLEVEVQFYIIAPFIAVRLFRLTKVLRKAVFLLLMVAFLAGNYFVELPFVSLINYFHYFILGFLLTDIYISSNLIFEQKTLNTVFAFTGLVLVWIFDIQTEMPVFLRILSESMQVFGIFLFYYFVLIQAGVGSLRRGAIPVIGGMCYSIYLIHTQVISFSGNWLLKYQGGLLHPLAVAFGTLLILAIASIAFFLLIERPCMQKNWYRHLWSKSSLDKKGNV